jgi:NAD(P)-dependent dehydrogenase (short-subunit alcohol dehydrogenase family)
MTTNDASAILSSRKALIIGANGGIGSAVAIALAQRSPYC